jgi:hypothetical protein
MPIDPRVAHEFLGDPPVGYPYVRFMVAENTARVIRPRSIPIDGRYFIAFGTVILASGDKFQAEFRMNTLLPTVLASALWHIGSAWYEAFEPSALEALSIPEAAVHPYAWAPYVPLRVRERPPYAEGQRLHPAGRLAFALWHALPGILSRKPPN